MKNTPKTVTLGLIQRACGTDPEANLAATLDAARAAARAGAQIICTQELFGTQYFCQSENHRNFELSEPIQPQPGPNCKAFQTLAREENVVVIASLFEQRAPGLFHNTAAIIDADGALASRNPEDLLDIFTLLTWAGQALGSAGQPVPEPLRAACARIAPTLRALRHVDGGLARFHGGGRGAEGRLDHALAASGVRAAQRAPAEGREPLTLAMGFARLSAGRCSVLVDAAPPPQGTAARTGHASTLAFEMTSARRPLIVNCGSGASFGETWRRAGRATPSHSTLCVDGVSSSRFAREHDGDAPAGLPAADLLAETPRDVRVQAGAAGAARSLLTGHDGWVATHGLTHMRKLVLARDGREIAGEDTLGAMTEQHRRRFERVVAEGALRGIAFRIRFHLHPDVEPSIDDDPDLNGGHGVTLALRSGEVWRFRHDGTAVLSVEPSVYLEPGRLKPRATRQLVLSGRVLDYACQIGWTLGKAQDTPQGIRDLARGDDDDMAFD